jgi:ribosomal-protein-alanine N-acetyltransferase
MAVRTIDVAPSAVHNWREGLPELHGERVRLRELRPSDAAALYHSIRIPEVARQMWPPPATIDAVERFIERTHERRALGQYIVFGVVPGGQTEIAGLFELRPLQPHFFRIELGYFLHPSWWGRGVFTEAARLICGFSFTVLGTQRIEARVSVENPRGNHALRKIGARREGRLHAAFVEDGRYIDQYLWAIVNQGAAPRPSPTTGDRR